MRTKFKEASEEYKLWCEIINDIYLEFDTTNDASEADDLTNKIEKLIDLISLPVEAKVMQKIAEAICIEDNDLRYGERTRILWEVNDFDNRNGLEDETIIKLKAKNFPIGTKIEIYIPEGDMQWT